MARRSILLGVAFLIAALGTVLVVLYVQGIDARASAGQERVSVLAASERIEPGETVEEAQAAGKLEKVDVLRADLVAGALDSTETLAGRVSTGTIYPGQQIISPQFGTAGSEETLTIPDDQMAISVELTDPSRVAGFVNPGSMVAIFASADPELIKPDGNTQKLPSYTWMLLPEVQVIGVGDTSVSSRTTTDESGEETVEEIPRTILTVAVDQAEAEKVIFAGRNGDLSFALRSEGTRTRTGPGVTATDLMPDVYGSQS